MSESFAQEFLDREEWRKWLEENHSSKEDIWVIIHKKKSGKKGSYIRKLLKKQFVSVG